MRRCEVYQFAGAHNVRARVIDLHARDSLPVADEVVVTRNIRVVFVIGLFQARSHLFATHFLNGMSPEIKHNHITLTQRLAEKTKYASQSERGEE